VELSAKPAFEHTTDPNVHTERQWEIGEWLEGAAGRGIRVDGWCAIDDEELVSLSEENRYESETGDAQGGYCFTTINPAPQNPSQIPNPRDSSREQRLFHFCCPGTRLSPD
jgi:hypothetical protein